jgi:hypothetical protein
MYFDTPCNDGVSQHGDFTRVYELCVIEVGPVDDCRQARSEGLGYNVRTCGDKSTLLGSVEHLKWLAGAWLIHALTNKYHRAVFKAVTVVHSENLPLYITLQRLYDVVTLHQHSTHDQVFHIYPVTESTRLHSCGHLSLGLARPDSETRCWGTTHGSNPSQTETGAFSYRI